MSSRKLVEALAASFADRYEVTTAKVGDPDWRPYCLVCTSMKRMEKTEYGFRCVACLNKINHDLTHKD